MLETRWCVSVHRDSLPGMIMRGEAAKLLGCSRRRVQQFEAEGRLRAVVDAKGDPSLRARRRPRLRAQARTTARRPRARDDRGAGVRALPRERRVSRDRHAHAAVAGDDPRALRGVSSAARSFGDRPAARPWRLRTEFARARRADRHPAGRRRARRPRLEPAPAAAEAVVLAVSDPIAPGRGRRDLRSGVRRRPTSTSSRPRCGAILRRPPPSSFTGSTYSRSAKRSTKSGTSHPASESSCGTVPPRLHAFVLRSSCNRTSSAWNVR